MTTEMIDKLEIKHLAPYLTYKLKCRWNKSKPYELIGLRKANRYVSNELWIFKDEFHYNTAYLYECIPMLYQISDLTKEIEVNGEKFVHIEKMTKIFGGRPLIFDGNCFYTKIQKSVVRKKEDVVPLHFSQLDAFNKLFEWHFDVFGLIEKGLAVDINTL
jgi:hypothetical protein